MRLPPNSIHYSLSDTSAGRKGERGRREARARNKEEGERTDQGTKRAEMEAKSGEGIYRRAVQQEDEEETEV